MRLASGISPERQPFIRQTIPTTYNLLSECSKCPGSNFTLARGTLKQTKGSAVCKTCPKGADCFEGAKVYAKRGFWCGSFYINKMFSDNMTKSHETAWRLLPEIIPEADPVGMINIRTRVRTYTNVSAVYGAHQSPVLTI